MCKDAPTPDPLIGEAARANAETAKKALDFYTSIYETDIRPAQQRDAAQREQLIGAVVGSMGQQQAIAADQYEYYKSRYRPVEEQSIRDAMEYDSQANIDRRMGIAAANVNQQFSNAAGQQARMLSRYGINPNSSAFARANSQLANQQALASAGAQTGAAFDTQDRAIALRAGVAGAGRGMPNAAAQTLANSSNSAGTAGNISAQGMGVLTQGVGVMGQGFNTAIQGNQSAGNLMLGDFQGRMQGYQADQAAIGGLFSGLGTFAGMTGGFGMFPRRAADGGYIDKRGLHMAEGGEVEGPGGPVDDRIPAMLSDGEYVVPADVVKAKGVEFFDKLRERYHTPAAVQRAGLRRTA